MMPTERPFLLAGDTARAVPRARAQAALDAWLMLWSRSGESRQVSVHSIGECAHCELDGAQYQVVTGARSTLYIRRDDDLASKLGQIVLGDALIDEMGGSGAWVTEIVDVAREACQRAVSEALTDAPPGRDFTWLDAPPSALFAPGSGALHIDCRPLGLHLYADAGVWRDALPNHARRSGTLTGLSHAVRDSAARLEVRLGEVDMEIAKITDLRAGDVLRLPQPLQEGISVLCEGQRLASGLLGEMLGQKCVQLTN
jgi:flagellar motor switch/type III secretory pathway protein FliN